MNILFLLFYLKPKEIIDDDKKTEEKKEEKQEEEVKVEAKVAEKVEEKVEAKKSVYFYCHDDEDEYDRKAKENARINANQPEFYSVKNIIFE